MSEPASSSASGRLCGKGVLITGSTTGIGAAIARRCVAEGARVLLHGLEVEEGERLRDELGEAAVLDHSDLRDEGTPAALVARAKEAFGGLDSLVNNAARVERSKLETTDVEVFDRVIAINLRAPLLLIRAALPLLSARRGAVLNVGSVNAYCGESSYLAYSISKGGLMTLTRNLGDTLHREHQVRVNQINPEWVLTEGERRNQERQGNPSDWFRRLPPEWAPSGDLIQPEQIAAAALYWISDESRPFSGCVCDLSQFPVIGRNPDKVL